MTTDHPQPAESRVVRRVRLRGASAACREAADRLARLKGVAAARFEQDGRRLRLDYDAADVGFPEIEAVLREAGCPLAAGWRDRLRRAWYRYVDENARANARTRASPCCSDPSEIYSRRRH